MESDQKLSGGDGVWWAVTTVTTVGYGDIRPETDAGRVIAMAVMLVGIGFVAIVTGAAAERFMRARREEERHMTAQLDEIVAQLDAMERRSQEP